MADQLLNDGTDDIFVYMGGEQRVPRDVRRAKIDESVDTILARAFSYCRQLIEVEGHDKLKKIENDVFSNCRSLKRITKMNGVKDIEACAFLGCKALSDAEFVKLEIVGRGAFAYCKSLRSINLPSVRGVEQYAFHGCEALTEGVFGEDLERIEGSAFIATAVRRIVIPLKDGLVIEDNAFYSCRNLSRVNIVGGVHETISSLHLESWRNEMREEIDSINQSLPEIQISENTVTIISSSIRRTITDTRSLEMAAAIRQWIRSVLNRMEHYKTEHQILLKEAMTLLELALWKAKLKGNRSNIDTEIVAVVRKQHRVTCGANIVVKNVLPFLVLK